MKILLTSLIASGLGLALLMGCEKATETSVEQTRPRLVRTQIISTPEQSFWREFPGVVDAARSAELGFRITGKLKSLLVAEGDYVESGQLLAELDETDQAIQLQSRLAEYEQAHADFQRSKTLIEKRLIARADFDKLQAQDATARAALSAARQTMEYTKLRAPFAGRISRRHVDNFEEVSAMQTVYTVQDDSSMTIKLDVPESVMIMVKEDARPDVVAIFAAIPDKQFPLTLKEVSTQSNPGTNTFEVTMSMPAIEGYNVLPGMSVTVRGQRDPNGADSENGIHVPAHAVMEDHNGRYVYLVKASSGVSGVVERRNVEIGPLTSMGLEIVRGLAQGDRIVTAGMSKMSQGLEVRLEQERID